MIGTPETKAAQLTNGYYQSGSGPRKILILGCCRTMAYLNYLVRWNNQNGNPFTIYRIDPTDFLWDLQGNQVNLEEVLDRCRTDMRILSVLEQSEVFIHEWYAYYGMFNTNREQEGNIYQYGLNPKQDICIPNFHDRFVLLQDHVTFDQDVRAHIQQNGVTAEILQIVRERGLSTLDRFYDICVKSSFPEFGDLFHNTWRDVRYFWTGNHVSKHFTLKLFEMMNEKFLRLSMDGYYLNEISQEDQFEKPNTRVTKYDVEMHGLSWGSPIEELEVK
jgi:hypothetical protein